MHKSTHAQEHLFILAQASWDGQPLLERLYQIMFVECFRKLKKSPALACFNHELTKFEEQLCDTESTQENPPQIFVEHFSFEELHYTMKRNNGLVIGLYDELSLLYEQLDRYKAGHADRKTILSLINGGCWQRNFRSSTSTLHTTCFNLTGFVQPTTVIQLTNSNDDDGFMDRQLLMESCIAVNSVCASWDKV